MKKFGQIIQWVQVISVLMLFSCGTRQQKIIKVDPGFGKYISGYTSGVIHKKDAIRIDFTEDLDQLLALNESERAKLLSIYPEVTGKVKVTSIRSLLFEPDEPLASDAFYTVSLKLDKLTKVAKGFELFQFQFATLPQVMQVAIEGMKNYHSQELNYQRLQVDISLTDYADIKEVEASFTLKYKETGKPIPFKIHHQYGHHYQLIADSIKRSKTAQVIDIKWDGSPLSSFSSGETSVEVTAIGDFSLQQVQVQQKDAHYIELLFSEPIDRTQNLNGLIELEGIANLTFKVSGNLVVVYLPNEIIGYRELKIHTGIKNTAGHKMKSPFSTAVYFEEPSPQLKLIGKGTILPDSKGLIFPFKSKALKSFDLRVIRINEKSVHHFLQVNHLDGNDELTRFGKIIYEGKIQLDNDTTKNLKQWNTHVLKLDKLITAEPGAIYQIAMKFSKEDATCLCDEEESVRHQNQFVQNSWTERYWHRYGFDGYSTWRYYDDYTDPCNDDYYYGKAVRRNILASNLGLIFKLDEDKTAHIFVSDMTTTAAVSGAKISFYDYAKNEIISTYSNEQGMAQVKLKEKPFLLVASAKKQKGYLKLTDGSVNSLSKFDISGEIVNQGIKGFIYAERGVWRPGDSIYVQFILQDEQKVLPNNHPVNMQLIDPNGAVVSERIQTTAKNGIYDFRTNTAASAITGNYRAQVNLGNHSFSKTIKIETVKPNRLKIAMEDQVGPYKDSCMLVASWLHGGVANGLTADVKVRLSPMKTTFENYSSYVFDSPIRNGHSGDKTLFHGVLDAFGKVKFVHDYSKNIKSAPGKLTANYTLKVTEKSGEFSLANKSSSISPYARYVGLQVPKTDKYSSNLQTGTPYRFDLVSLSNEGKEIAGTKLAVRVYQVNWNWWYDGEEDMASFVARSSATTYFDTVITTKSKNNHFFLNIPDASYGKYVITVTDKIGGHQTGAVVHFDWSYWNRANNTNNEHAAMLSFATNKDQYQVGEQVHISFPSPAKGKALISLETSNKVIKKWWINTEKGESVASFMATKEMAPNIYAHITLLQPHDHTVNDLPIRLYGVLPVKIDDPSTHLNPQILMEDNIKPNRSTTIKVKEENGRKMTYTLAVVDEGLLSLTNYRTPKPHEHFYAREALGVKTWDIYDDVLGAYGGKLDHLLSIGGDGSLLQNGARKANRFEPMVRFMGPFELAAGQTQAHEVAIPNYIGAVKVMVVARNGAAYGNADKSVLVNQPVMVLSAAPRVLSPLDEFVLPVTVFAMDKSVKNVNITLKTNENLNVVGGTQKTIAFGQPGEIIVPFLINVKETIGLASIEVEVSAGKETAVHRIEVDIVAPNPKVTVAKTYTLAAGQSLSTAIELDGIKGSHKATIELSSLPAFHLEKRLSYLVNYPHGCIEQTTSAVFPQLYLSSLMTLKDQELKKIDQHIKKGINRLSRFQTLSGGFSYWPGEAEASEWGTNYAGHFFLEAEQMGYLIPKTLKNKWLNYQKNKSNQWVNNTNGGKSDHQSDQLTQAYRLYLLALAGSPEVGAMNRLREMNNLSNPAKWRLASAYALIGQQDIGMELYQKSQKKVMDYKELSQSYGSGFRDLAILLEVQTLLNDQEGGNKTLIALSKTLRSESWLSTQETGYSLLAIALHSKASSNTNNQTLSWGIDNGKRSQVKCAKAIEQINVALDETKKQQTLSIDNTSASSMYVTVTMEKIPSILEESTSMSNLSMGLNYYTWNNEGCDVKNLSQGEEFKAVITIHNPTKNRMYQEMALHQLFPSGWEIHNERLFGANQLNGAIRYQDIRDDRVYSYFDLRPGETKTITVLLTATYKGKFYHPSLFAEAMYDHTINALLPGFWVEVK